MAANGLDDVLDKAQLALKEVEADAGASPVLAAVVRELVTKTSRAIDRADGERAWEAVIEAEQAGDSAKAAAEADAGAGEPATAAVLDAHLAICILKAGMASAPA